MDFCLYGHNHRVSTFPTLNPNVSLYRHAKFDIDRTINAVSEILIPSLKSTRQFKHA